MGGIPMTTVSEPIRAALDGADPIRVGLTAHHGMADEQTKSPPDGVEFSFLKLHRPNYTPIRSPIKSYLYNVNSDEHDVLEAVLSPIRTENNWLGSLDCFQAAVAFDLMGLPTPKSLRVHYINRLLAASNCKGLLFWSEAAMQTLRSYGGVRDKRVLDKSMVVYPAVRAPSSVTRSSRPDSPHLLFSGDFFRKGGLHVLDVFEDVQKLYPHARLTVCSDPDRDFNISDKSLREETLRRLRTNSAVELGRVGRERMIKEILPTADAYLLPTYAEAFGFAILEAMSYGVPVISTRVFAIPEIITDGVSGMLVDFDDSDFREVVKGYRVSTVPRSLRSRLNEELWERLKRLLDSQALRIDIGEQSRQTAASKFGFPQRNEIMRQVYVESSPRR